jgi:hypothetical protein
MWRAEALLQEPVIDRQREEGRNVLGMMLARGAENRRRALLVTLPERHMGWPKALGMFRWLTVHRADALRGESTDGLYLA